jgi:hypothetical protein
VVDDSPDPAARSPRLDSTVPHSARVWNYWLGGRENFAVDRAVGDQVREIYPEIIDIARASRAFLARVVGYLAGTEGVRQFLDIGSGLPTADNTHEVAQRLAPESRVVYVDKDALVLVHARALLTSTPQGATAYLDADVRDPAKILAGAAEILDFTRPIAVMMLGVMGNIADTDEAYGIVRWLVDAVPSGSYLVLNDGTSRTGEAGDRANEAAQRREEAGDPYYIRTPEEIAGFFAGLELVEPGVVSAPLWRPDADAGADPTPVGTYCGVARKP